MEICHRHKIGHARTGWAVPVGAAAVVGTYCLALRRYGLELSRRDFPRGSGPALFYGQAALFAAFGASIPTVRTGPAHVHAARVALDAAEVGTIAGARAALVVVLLVATVFLSGAPGIGTPTNLPCPAWYASVLGLTALVFLARTRIDGAIAAWGRSGGSASR